MSTIFSGRMSCGELCQPAPSRISKAGAKQVGPGEPPVAPDMRTRAALGPDAGQRALLANTGFILKPDFDRPAGKLLRDCGAGQFSEVFLKASCASRSLCGCTGRTGDCQDFRVKAGFVTPT